eukprot:NODE_67_length_25542_cov_1.476831.p15 type:complete len:234 gc:universal NODE_67_length_25542_cov_1.476831:23001-22300(-)
MPILTIQKPKHYFITYNTCSLTTDLLSLIFNSDINQQSEHKLGMMNIIDLNKAEFENIAQDIYLDKSFKFAVKMSLLLHDEKVIQFYKNKFTKFGAAYMNICTLRDYDDANSAVSRLVSRDPLERFLDTRTAEKFVIETYYYNGKTSQIVDIKNKKIQSLLSFQKKLDKIESKEDRMLDQLTFNLKLTEQEKDAKEKVVLAHQQEKGAINYVPDEFDDFDESDDLDLDNDLDF